MVALDSRAAEAAFPAEIVEVALDPVPDDWTGGGGDA